MEREVRKTAEEQFPKKIYASQLLTIDDLQQFKKQLLEELLAAFKSQTGAVPKKWLKSYEVRRFLKISPGTFQTLKSSGMHGYTIPGCNGSARPSATGKRML